MEHCLPTPDKIMAYTKPGKTKNRIYQFVRKRLLAGQPPTVREVQKQFGMRAVQSAKSHLDALVREGRLIKESGKARGYRLPANVRPGALVPIVGRVQAGPFNAAIQDIEGYIPVQSQTDSESVFALRIKGDSMMDAGILDGDVVLVRPEQNIYQGDIVVAMVGEETVVKEFRRHGKKVQLYPHNSNYPVLSLEAKDLAIVGKVVEVRRYLEKLNLIIDNVDS